MRRTIILLVVTALATTAARAESQSTGGTVAEAQRKVEAKQAVTSFFWNTIVPGQSECNWELQDRNVFPFSFVALTGVNLTPVADQRDQFRAVIRFWCEGTNPSGERVKQRRTLNVDFRHAGSGSKPEVAQCSFVPPEPLTMTRQVTTCVVWILIAPCVLMLGVLVLGGSDAPAFASRLAAVCMLFLVPYIGYVCFGTALAALIVLIAYIGSNMLLAAIAAEL